MVLALTTFNRGSYATNSPGVQRKALILLWTKKVCFELGLQGISLETKERAWLSRLNKVYTKKQGGGKNNDVIRKDRSISLESSDVCTCM